MTRLLRKLAAALADWFDQRGPDHCHTIAGHLRGWAGR